MTPEFIRQIKEYGFSDKYVAMQVGVSETEFRQHRKQQGVKAVYKTVDTCGAEFEAARRTCIRPTKRNARPTRPSDSR
jgi:carbamoyl-phosphate synthase large subunit